MQRSCYKLIKTKYCWVQYSSGKMEKWENYVWKWYISISIISRRRCDCFAIFQTYIHNNSWKGTLWSRLTNILHNISLASLHFIIFSPLDFEWKDTFTQTYIHKHRIYTHKPAHRHTKYFTGIMYFSFESSFHRAINFRRNFFTYFIAVRVAI